MLDNLFTENAGAHEKMEFHPKITSQKFNALEKKALTQNSTHSTRATNDQIISKRDSNKKMEYCHFSG